MAKQLKVRPLDDRVVVEPLEAEEMTAGGIVLARQLRKKSHSVVRWSRSVPGRLLDNGDRGELSVAIGDEVILRQIQRQRRRGRRARGEDPPRVGHPGESRQLVIDGRVPYGGGLFERSENEDSRRRRTEPPPD